MPPMRADRHWTQERSQGPDVFTVFAPCVNSSSVQFDGSIERPPMLDEEV